jgi:hypothetical protein
MPSHIILIADGFCFTDTTCLFSQSFRISIATLFLQKIIIFLAYQAENKKDKKTEL